MNRNEYAVAVRRTMPAPHAVPDLQLAIFALGLCGEASEFVECVEDTAYDRGVLDPEPHQQQRILKEAGDCCWYAFAIANTLGFDLDGEVLYAGSPQHVAGTIAERVKKALGHGEPLNRENLRGLLLLFLASVTYAAQSAGDEAQILGTNIEKLRKRYPHGFSVEASLNRSDRGDNA